MAGIALELGALAFIARVVMAREDDAPAPPVPQSPPPPPTIEQASAPKQARRVFLHPMDFIRDPADAGARYYRASGDGADLVAGFYSDGRVRLSDERNHRFAGMLQGGHADLLELESNQWSELLVHTTPSGNMQLELRGGPYDSRVLSCDILQVTQ